MLSLSNGAIYEQTGTYTSGSNNVTSGYVESCVGSIYQYPYTQTVYWGNYPVYICADKTKKAIEILKALQADKHIECKSVPKFIELVEKISNLL